MTFCRSLLWAVLAVMLVLPWPAGHAQIPQDWISLGARIHGAFGAFIPVGIRIGLDARERLKAEGRDLTAAYYSGENAPCPCIADGIMIATNTSPGQGTLQVAAEKAPAGLLGMAVIRDRRTGAGLRYSIAQSWLPRIGEFNRTLDPMGRFDAVMKADGLFTSEPVEPAAAR
jgi:hypothetical protein